MIIKYNNFLKNILTKKVVEEVQTQVDTEAQVNTDAQVEDPAKKEVKPTETKPAESEKKGLPVDKKKEIANYLQSVKNKYDKITKSI